ncbi:Hypothetical predicted protein, partial [Podarcis lilfordi]
MAPRRCGCGIRLLLRPVVVLLLLLLLLGASASAGAAPPCPSSPPSVDSVQGLARRASVVIEGKVLAHSVVEPGGGGGGGGDGGGGEEATSLLLLLPSPPPPLLTLPEQQQQQQQPTAASASSTTFSGTVPSPAPRALVPSPSPPPVSWVTRVRVHQVWPAKSGGLRKDGLLWVLLAERGSACGSSLKEESRYIFFMEPVNGTGAPSLLLPSPSPLFRASSPPLETGRSLKKEVSRALCTRGC